LHSALIPIGGRECIFFRELPSKLPSLDARRTSTLQLLATWKISLELTGTLDQEDRELMAALTQAYLDWEQKTKQEGLEQGLEQGQRLVVESLISDRFGELDDDLLTVIPALLSLSATAYARLLLELPQLSKDELLARF
jgi:hypothetical protein